jgi:hypothetical protein
MVDKVKCGNKDCKLFDVAVPVSNLYINRVAPLEGPWPCPACGDGMKIAHVIPNNYKGNGPKTMPKRRVESKPSSSRTVGKKKPARRKSVKRRVAFLGMGKAAPSLFKQRKSKSAGRKRGPQK